MLFKMLNLTPKVTDYTKRRGGREEGEEGGKGKQVNFYIFILLFSLSLAEDLFMLATHKVPLDAQPKLLHALIVEVQYRLPYR